MNNKTTNVELTQSQLVWLEEYLGDRLKDDVEDEETQAFYIKVEVALGRNRNEVEAEVKGWEASERHDRAYEAELAKLKEKYYPKEKAA